jgi:signal peptidase I
MTDPEATSPDSVGAAADGASEDAGDNSSRGKKAGKKAFSAGREIVIVIVVALVISAVVRAFLFQAFYVPSQSMENTLLINDRILVSKIELRLSHV